MGKMLQLTL
ncbi:hypothetical protein D030_1690A, partial [Vibrio parahaemolyticus AQ3810]